MTLFRPLVTAAALLVVPTASAAVGVATSASSPALQVDAAGRAEISWSTGEARKTVTLRPDGTVVKAAVAATDVSQPVRGRHIPWQRVLRSAPGGWYYALQARGGELRFSRWRGVPTEVSLSAVTVPGGVRLSGRATLDEKPLGAVAAILETKVDGRWQTLAAIRLNATGHYSKRVPLSASRIYRTIVPGPGLAPDATAEVHAIELDPGR